MAHDYIHELRVHIAHDGIKQWVTKYPVRRTPQYCKPVRVDEEAVTAGCDRGLSNRVNVCDLGVIQRSSMLHKTGDFSYHVFYTDRAQGIGFLEKIHEIISTSLARQAEDVQKCQVNMKLAAEQLATEKKSRREKEAAAIAVAANG